ncbi:MAG: ROK family transcriptional regulator [Deltaproteobacteria bacterium]|nr:ROK family transcriptional regulator [Deltaproteobacteria bacterium]
MIESDDTVEPTPRWWRKTVLAQTPTLDPGKLRSENRRVLLNLVWSEHAISRAELARVTGLSRSTVSAIATELLDTGLVVERGAGSSSGGRRPIVLGFDDDAFGIVGVDLGASHVGVAVTDLRGRVRAWVNRPCDVREDPDGTLTRVRALVREAVAASPWAFDRLLGIGVAAPCPIDPATPGRLSPLVLPAWRDHDLAAAMRDAFGLPVWLDNDANLGALAELWWGAGVDGADLAYIKVATGVGAGFVLHGALHRGAAGVAGEIGHVVLDPDGALCMCGLRGCLVTQIGSAALIGQAEQHLASGHTSALARGRVTLDSLVEAALAGDPVATEVVHRAGRQLGIAIANVLNLLNPERVVVSGGLTRAGRVLFLPLEEIVERRTLFSARARARVMTSTLGETGVAVGAATQVLEAMLADETLIPAREASA